MRIFFSITDNYPPYRVDVAELFGNCLPNKGVYVEWYMRRGASGSSATADFMGQIVHLSFKTSKFGIIGKVASKLAFWLEDIWQLILCLGRSLDIIQVRDKYISALVGLLIARVKGIKFIYWCSYPFPEHDLENAKLSTGIKSSISLLKGLIGELVLYRVIMRFADHVFVQSDQMKLDIAEYGVPLSKMTPVPMGVPQRLLEFSDKVTSSVVPNRVVYLGTMTTVRQLNILIEAFSLVLKQYPSATFVMVGDGEHPYEREALEQQVLSLGLKNAVLFTGFVPIEDAWTYAATGAICVSPFAPSKVLNSASPTKLHEYMALGRPVVCNTHPDQSAVIDQTNAGLSVEWSAECFAEAILWMLNHSAEAEEMGNRGPKWIAENRTYPILANLVFETYKKVLQVVE